MACLQTNDIDVLVTNCETTEELHAICNHIVRSHRLDLVKHLLRKYCLQLKFINVLHDEAYGIIKDYIAHFGFMSSNKRIKLSLADYDALAQTPDGFKLLVYHGQLHLVKRHLKTFQVQMTDMMSICVFAQHIGQLEIAQYLYDKCSTLLGSINWSDSQMILDTPL